MSNASPAKPDLLGIIATAGEHLRADLRARLISHKGELGRAREATVREFLKAQLPRNLEISTGLVFDVNGNVSDQLDIVISDPATGGAYLTPGDITLFRAESALAAGQVKSTIGSKKELWSAFDNLRSVSYLDRSAGGKAVCLRTGEPIRPSQVHNHRIFTFLFVASGSLSPATCREVLLDYVAYHQEPHQWPNLVFFLDSCFVTFACYHGICPNALDAYGITLLEEDGLNLARFVRFLVDGVVATSPAYTTHASYLPGLFPAAKADIFYSTFHEEGEPPPLISNWITAKCLPRYVDGDQDEEDSSDGK